MTLNHSTTAYVPPNPPNWELYLAQNTNPNFRIFMGWSIVVTILCTMIILFVSWFKYKRAIAGKKIIGKKTLLSRLTFYSFFSCLITMSVAVLIFYYKNRMNLGYFKLNLGLYGVYFIICLVSIIKAESFIEARGQIGKGTTYGKLAIKTTRNSFLVISGISLFGWILLLM